MKKHLLVAFPHPDDEAFSSSGTIVLHRKKGIPVTYICGTLGEMGRNMGNPPFANRETLPMIRKKELENACKVMGIEDLRMLGLRDKTLEFEDLDLLADRIGAIIDEVNPTLIITFYPGYSVHPDHDTFGAAVLRAAERMPEQKRPVIHCVAFSNNCVDELGKPDVVNDVSSVVDTKIAAFKSHRSQVEGFRGGIKEKLDKKDPETMRWINKERFWTYKFSS